MNVDYVQFQKESKIDDEMAKDIYGIKTQKKSIDENIYMIQNRIKHLEIDEQKKQLQIENKIKLQQKLSEISNFKEYLQQEKQYKNQQLEKLNLNYSNRAKKNRESHLKLMIDINVNIQDKKKKDVIELQKQRLEHEKFIIKQKEENQRKKINNVQSVRSDIKKSQFKIHEHWIDQFQSYSNEKQQIKQQLEDQKYKRQQLMDLLLKEKQLKEQKIQQLKDYSIQSKTKNSNSINSNNLSNE